MQQGAPLLTLTELGLIEFLARYVHASLVHLSESMVRNRPRGSPNSMYSSSIGTMILIWNELIHSGGFMNCLV
jgi:hypothetical protein